MQLFIIAMGAIVCFAGGWYCHKVFGAKAEAIRTEVDQTLGKK